MKYPSYTYPLEKLSLGSSLGNYFLFARFDAETNLKGLWCADDDQYYLGEWEWSFAIDGIPVHGRFTEFFPESQSTTYSHEGLSLTKQVFIPFFLEEPADRHVAEMHSLIYLIRMRNESTARKRIQLRHMLYFPADRSPLFTKQPPLEQMDKRVRIEKTDRSCEVLTEGFGEEARILSCGIPWKICEGNDSSLMLEFEMELERGEMKNVPFVMAISHEGIEKARSSMRKLEDPESLLATSVKNFRELLSRSRVITPEPVINRGIDWAKVNTVRVQHRYRIGEAFTNDPPQDIVVIRDVAWYVLGSDYVTPSFSQNLLTLVKRFACHEGGKLTEFLHANDSHPEKHDYNLNINDDTPLYIYALYHHASSARKDDVWKEFYPMMRSASDWIIAQMKDGLVWCTADGMNVWGICGWRNIIDKYTLSGAVTEVNAECAFSLECTAEVARRIGRVEDAGRYSSHAETLRTSINKDLISSTTGLFLLNRDVGGEPHHDVTGDLIFPVLFGEADSKMRRRVLDRLTREDMWTPFGSRTVSAKEKNYDPDLGYQLMGGVWPNLTAWTAFCLGRDDPDRLVEGMKNIYGLSEIANPREYGNVVPGEFPERLHGESFASRGMALSPWMPPTYLWLGIEGLLGVNPKPDEIEMSPRIPSSWKWIAVRDLLYRGAQVSAVLFDGVLYSSLPVKSIFPVRTGDVVDAQCENESIDIVCLKIGTELILFAVSGEKADEVVRIKYQRKVVEYHLTLDAGEGILVRIPEVGAPTVQRSGGAQ